MDREFKDIPLSESNVSLKLADIQKRCANLVDDPDYLGDLSLEEPIAESDKNNPYSRG